MSEWKEIVKLSPEEKKKIKYDDPRLDAFAREVEAKYGLPPGLLVAVKNAGERSNSDQVSKAGAKGVMQFIDSTRKLYSHNPSDPLASIDAGGRYFKDLLKGTKGNIKEALIDYNWGRGNRMSKGIENLPEETQNYITNVFAYAKKNFKGQEFKAPPVVEASVDWAKATKEDVFKAVNTPLKKGQKPVVVDWKKVSDDTLLNLDQTTLLQARDQVQPLGDQELIDRMAYYDYIAFARELVRENPINAITMPANSVGWTTAKYAEKAAQKLGREAPVSRSSPSLDQVAAGVQGTIMGLAEAFKGKGIDFKEMFSGKEGAVQEGS